MSRVNRAEFKRRLYRLYMVLGRYFASGDEGNLFPYLYSVFSYMWCKNHNELIK